MEARAEEEYNTELTRVNDEDEDIRFAKEQQRSKKQKLDEKVKEEKEEETLLSTTDLDFEDNDGGIKVTPEIVEVKKEPLKRKLDLSIAPPKSTFQGKVGLSQGQLDAFMIKKT